MSFLFQGDISTHPPLAEKWKKELLGRGEKKGPCQSFSGLFLKGKVEIGSAPIQGQSEYCREREKEPKQYGEGRLLNFQLNARVPRNKVARESHSLLGRNPNRKG